MTMLAKINEERKEAYAEGQQQGQNKAFLLIQKLFAAGRPDDARRAAEDPAFQKKMMEEFAL